MNTQLITSLAGYRNSNFTLYLKIVENLSIIPDEQLKTLLAISKYAPNAYPKIETLAEITGRSKRTVMRDIKKLEEAGVIKVTRKHRLSNFYDITLSDKALSPKQKTLGDKQEGGKVTTGDTHIGDTAMSPQHIKKHIKEHIGDVFLGVEKEDEADLDSYEKRKAFVESLKVLQKKEGNES
jgi:DNA-binding transcriptional ArsR family regulator